MFVITGGGSGVGRALARALAARDKKILIIGRRKQALAETADFSPLISYLSADVSTEIGRQKIVDHLQDTPALEGLVHNAAIIEPISRIVDITSSAWQQILATNLNAPLFLNQLLYSKLQQGRVLHIGSGAAYLPIESWAGYCVSKAALSMQTRCWQVENPDMAFTSVMPGIIDTDMQSLIRHAQAMDPEKRDFFKRLQQERKLISPITVALFITWLLLDLEKTRYVEKEWDIYDRSHHASWLTPPHQVPDLE